MGATEAAESKGGQEQDDYSKQGKEERHHPLGVIDDDEAPTSLMTLAASQEVELQELMVDIEGLEHERAEARQAGQRVTAVSDNEFDSTGMAEEYDNEIKEGDADGEDANKDEKGSGNNDRRNQPGADKEQGGDDRPAERTIEWDLEEVLAELEDMARADDSRETRCDGRDEDKESEDETMTEGEENVQQGKRPRRWLGEESNGDSRKQESKRQGWSELARAKGTGD